jgi:hypothetical protein
MVAPRGGEGSGRKSTKLAPGGSFSAMFVPFEPAITPATLAGKLILPRRRRSCPTGPILNAAFTGY